MFEGSWRLRVPNCVVVGLDGHGQSACLPQMRGRNSQRNADDAGAVVLSREVLPRQRACFSRRLCWSISSPRKGWWNLDSPQHTRKELIVNVFINVNLPRPHTHPSPYLDWW